MQANELRIGNLVINNFHDNLPKILEISLKELSVIEMYEDLGHSIPFNPIPLTEEWLLRVGFEKYSNFNELAIKISNQNHFLVIGNNQFYIEAQENDNLYCASCIYVHQLQNLYFALTGEELKIKE